MNYGEELAYWYLRLNGCFPLADFAFLWQDREIGSSLSGIVTFSQKGFARETSHHREPDHQFAVSDQKRDALSVWQNKIPQHRNHERICPVLNETINPVLKAATRCELPAKNFILRKNQKQRTHGNAQPR